MSENICVICGKPEARCVVPRSHQKHEDDSFCVDCYYEYVYSKSKARFELREIIFNENKAVSYGTTQQRYVSYMQTTAFCRI